MPKHVIESDRNTQWVVNKDGHTWILKKQAMLDVDPGPAILIEDGFDRNKFFIDGDIKVDFISETAIHNDGDRNNFTIGKKSEISSNLGFAGAGDHTRIVNDGRIGGVAAAIAQNEGFTLINRGDVFARGAISVAQADLIDNRSSGVIDGQFYGIILFGDGESKIVNRGIISGNAASITDQEGSVVIKNMGTLDGNLDLGAGHDVLNSFKGQVNGEIRGGAGADIYRISQSNLMIVEALDEGNDAVYSTVNFTLWSNIEGLALKGNKNINGAGNDSNNEIVGNKGNNQLYGVGGEDMISGFGGNDELSGGADGDNFLFSNGFGKDVITDFEHGLDTIAFVGVKGLNDVDDVMSRLDQRGADVWIVTNGGKLILQGIDAMTLDENDFSVLHA